jgi:glycosyltransferase involved in cell wall biosynthesis
MTCGVVMPAFNAADYIAAAIDSVLSQTRPVTEIIVIDDGSTDSTREIVAAYPRVKWISQDHQGPSAARNAGIRHAQGEWIAFLDADDLWLAQKLQKQMTGLSRHPNATFSFSTLASFYTRDEVEVTNEPYVPEELSAWLNSRSIEEGGAFGNVYELLLRANCVLTSSLVARRDALIEAGLFDESMAHGEDHDLWLRLARRWPAVFITELIAKYRVHSSSLSGGWQKRQGLFYRSTVETLSNHRCMFPSFEASRALAIAYNNYAVFQLKEREWNEAKRLAGRGLCVMPTPAGFRLWLEAAFPKVYSQAVGFIRGGRAS